MQVITSWPSAMVRVPTNESLHPKYIYVIEGEIMETRATRFLSLLFQPIWCAFYLFFIMVSMWCIDKGSNISVYDIAFVLSLKKSQFINHRGWNM